MAWTPLRVPDESPDNRFKVAREAMTSLVVQLDSLLDKIEKQYEEVKYRERE